MVSAMDHTSVPIRIKNLWLPMIEICWEKVPIVYDADLCSTVVQQASSVPQ